MARCLQNYAIIYWLLQGMACVVVAVTYLHHIIILVSASYGCFPKNVVANENLDKAMWSLESLSFFLKSRNITVQTWLLTVLRWSQHAKEETASVETFLKTGMGWVNFSYRTNNLSLFFAAGLYSYIQLQVLSSKQSGRWS